MEVRERCEYLYFNSSGAGTMRRKALLSGVLKPFDRAEPTTREKLES